MTSAHVNGTELEYEVRGSGDPVVLVHGTLGDARSWEPQLGPLAEHHRVVAYSRRYHHPHARSDGGPDYSAALHADDLDALTGALGLDDVHVVGSSYGAYTALLLSQRHQERVRSLVLSEPPVLPLLEDHPEGRPIRDEFLAAVWAPAGEVLREGRLEEGVERFVDGLFGEGAFAGLPAEVHDLVMDNAPELVLETSSPDFWTGFTCGDAGRIETPTLLLSGGRSLRMFQLVVEELERCLPNNRHVRIPDSSHDVPGEHPDEFNRLVLDFLAAQRP